MTGVSDPPAGAARLTAPVPLSWDGRLRWWVSAVMVVRELGVTVLRFGVIRREVLVASWGGKAKTLLQILAISWYLWPFPASLGYVGRFVMFVAVVVTL